MPLTSEVLLEYIEKCNDRDETIRVLLDEAGDAITLTVIAALQQSAGFDSADIGAFAGGFASGLTIGRAIAAEASSA